jgi:hypothetical protein
MALYRTHRQPSGRSVWRRRASDNGAGLTSVAILRWSHPGGIGWHDIAAGGRVLAGADIMNAIVLRVALATLMGAAIATPVAAQDYPPAGYSALLFSRAAAARLPALVPWVCVADSICKRVLRALPPRPAPRRRRSVSPTAASISPSSTRATTRDDRSY